MKGLLGSEADEPNYKLLAIWKRESHLRAAVFKAWESVSFAVGVVTQVREDKPHACSLLGLPGSTKAAYQKEKSSLPIISKRYASENLRC